LGGWGGGGPGTGNDWPLLAIKGTPRGNQDIPRGPKNCCKKVWGTLPKKKQPDLWREDQ